MFPYSVLTGSYYRFLLVHCQAFCGEAFEGSARKRPKLHLLFACPIFTCSGHASLASVMAWSVTWRAVLPV